VSVAVAFTYPDHASPARELSPGSLFCFHPSADWRSACAHMLHPIDHQFAHVPHACPMMIGLRGFVLSIVMLAHAVTQVSLLACIAHNSAFTAEKFVLILFATTECDASSLLIVWIVAILSCYGKRERMS
jgi:hypothetical protein